MLSLKVEVVRQDSEGLTRSVWGFELSERGELVLKSFSNEQRETRRHKWQIVGPCFRGGGGVDYRHGNWMPREDVPLPDDVAKEAVNAVVASLKVVVPDGCFERRAESKKRGY
jgi:hypothetical protein